MQGQRRNQAPVCGGVTVMLADKLLDTFASSDESSIRVQSLTDLMMAKVIPRRADDAHFEAGLQRWIAYDAR